MKEKIIELRKNGRTINEICKILGCAKSTVSYHISKIEETIYGDFEKNQVDEVIRLINNNTNIKDVSVLLNLTLDEVRKIKKSNESKINYSINKDMVIEKYHEIKSIKKVAKILGIASTTIKKILDDSNIELYKRSSNISKSQSVINWRIRKKDNLLDYKGGKCQVCSYDKSRSALHFHHINPLEKDFQISGKSYSFERLKSEVDKCILVCSNCHCEIHDEINIKGYSDIVNKIIKNIS